MPLLTEEDLERSRRIRAERAAAGDTTFEMNRANGEPTLVAMSGVVNGWRRNGAALPPAQGGPSFSPSEMQVLAGGQSSAAPIVSGASPADRTVPPAASGIDLDEMRKELEDSLSTIDTTAALEDARKNLGKVLAPERENPPLILKDDAERRSAAGDESWRLSPDEQAKWERTMSERRRRNAAAAKSAMVRSLSGGHVAGPRITDDEAFEAEDAMIISSSTISDTPPPF